MMHTHNNYREIIPLIQNKRLYFLASLNDTNLSTVFLVSNFMFFLFFNFLRTHTVHHTETLKQNNCYLSEDSFYIFQIAIPFLFYLYS